MSPDRLRRLHRVNELLILIAGRGRHFFSSGGMVSHFSRTHPGPRVWFVDCQLGPFWAGYRGRWRHFSGGGTLHALVWALGQHIRTGHGIAPAHLAGTHWAYPAEDMQLIRDHARLLRIIR